MVHLLYAVGRDSGADRSCSGSVSFAKPNIATGRGNPCGSMPRWEVTKKRVRFHVRAEGRKPFGPLVSQP
jgi:hypothetical protein